MLSKVMNTSYLIYLFCC